MSRKPHCIVSLLVLSQIALGCSGSALADELTVSDDSACSVSASTGNLEPGTGRKSLDAPEPERTDEGIGKTEENTTPIVIDNDREEEEAPSSRAAIDWTERADQDGSPCIASGSKFAVSISSSLTSKTAQVGDGVDARLTGDITINGCLVAGSGSRIIGHVSDCKPARKLLRAQLSRKRWFRCSGALGLQFDEIVTPDGKHIPVVARPARQPLIVKNKAEGRILGVNDKGQITAPLSVQLKIQAMHTGISSLMRLGGPFGLAARPVVFGVVGALCPSFSYKHMVGTNVHHRRLKGFALGAFGGLPLGGFASNAIIRGPECIILPGDQLLVELKQPFDGKPISTVVASGAHSQVHGEIVHQRHQDPAVANPSSGPVEQAPERSADEPRATLEIQQP